MKKYFFVFLLVTTILLSNCTSLFKKPNTVDKGIMEIDLKNLEPDQFDDYLSQLNEYVQNVKSDSDRKQAYLRIAFANIYHRNPSIRYDSALESFNKYLKLEPEQKDKDEIINWIHLLKQLKSFKLEFKIVTEKLALLNEKNQNLVQKVADQAKTIKQLENKIKRLDALYFKIEKKKKKNNNNKSTHESK